MTARYDYLLSFPEEHGIAKALKAAMQAIDDHKPELGYIGACRQATGRLVQSVVPTRIVP